MTFQLPEKMPEPGESNPISAQKWIDDLLEELRLTDAEMAPPPWKINAEVEKEIAVIDDDVLKKLYTLSAVLGQEYRHQQIDLKHTVEDSEDYRRLEISARRTQMKSNVLSEIFWAVIREKFNIISGDLGVRQGWKIVESTRKKHNPFIQMMQEPEGE